MRVGSNHGSVTGRRGVAHGGYRPRAELFIPGQGYGPPVEPRRAGASLAHTVLPSSCTLTPQRVASAVTINSPHPPAWPTHRNCGRGGVQRRPSPTLMVIPLLCSVSVICGAH